MLLDAACSEPSPAPQERNTAPAADAPSERDAGPAAEAQPKQTIQNRDEKACRSDDNGIASQDPPAAAKPQETAADPDPATAGEGHPGEAASNDGESDGTTPQAGQATDAIACLLAMSPAIAGAPPVGTASDPGEIRPDCQAGESTQTPAAALAAIAQLADTNSAAALENTEEDGAPQTADSETATTAPAAVAAAAEAASAEPPSSGVSPTDSADGDANPSAPAPTAFVEAAGLVQAAASAGKRTSDPSSAPAGASGQSSDKDNAGTTAPAGLVIAISGKPANLADPSAKDDPAPKGETAPKKSALTPEESQGQAKPDITQSAALTLNGTNSSNVPSGSRIQSKASSAKTESELTDQPLHRIAAAHLATDTAPAQTIRTGGLPFALPAGADTLPASAAAIVANQSAQPAPLTAPALAFATPNAIPLAGLPVEIATQAKAGNNRFDIRLDPPELGRIDVRLDIDTKGNVTSRLMVERPETLDLLRRDAPQLERALQDAGLKTSDQGMQFSLRDQSFAGSDRTQLTTTYVIPDDDVTASAIIQQSYGQRAGLGAGIDIRV